MGQESKGLQQPQIHRAQFPSLTPHPMFPGIVQAGWLDLTYIHLQRIPENTLAGTLPPQLEHTLLHLASWLVFSGTETCPLNLIS